MPFLIRKAYTQLYLRSEVDSAGLSVFWVNNDLADTFPNRLQAEKFRALVAERYPSESFHLEYES